MSDVIVPAFRAEPYDYGEARRIATELDLLEPVAIALVRRGHRTVEAARAFLEAAETHDPDRFEGIGEALAAVTAAIDAGRRVTVHGDYDVDGICATTILVGALRRAGADCDWLIPDRLADGYGLSAATIERLSERGTGLMITVDCGITSAAEVELARVAGIAVVVSDHHEPAERLPDCPIVHPKVSRYPFEGLCGAAVAYKLALALERASGADPDEARDLDLVALATVADMVPLVDENRVLVRRGLRELRRARRPGIRALLAAAKIEPERVDEGDIGFRLGPRLNAAGRLYRADAGVELMLTDDASRAASIAAELDGANHERRATEREVRWSAEARLRELAPELREAPALVIDGEGWHPGVVGIVASRIVERHGRPAIVVSVDGEGRARGSGRSVGGFDLLAALDACASHLDRYGGHRAACGVELPAEGIEAFREAFVAHARSAVPEQGLAEPERVDGVVGAEGLDLQVAEQLQALAPFGQGNPGIRLLVPGARVGDVRTMGAEGKHARFSLSTGGLSARAVAFNANGTLEAAQRSPHDLTVKLELNHWNGAVEARAVLEGASERNGGEGGAHDCRPEQPGAWWWERLDRELDRDLEAPAAPAGRPERVAIDARRGSPVARIGELLSSGATVLALGADAGRRAALAESADASRFGGVAATVCLRCAPDQLEMVAARRHELLLTDWASLAAAPDAGAGFEHVVAVDPPPEAALSALALGGTGAGYLHEAWGAAPELAELCWEAEWGLRGALAEIYRALAATGELSGAALAAALSGAGRYGRSPEAGARCLRVLAELSLVESSGCGSARRLRSVSSERTELERSRAWRACARAHEEGLRYLEMRRAKR